MKPEIEKELEQAIGPMSVGPGFLSRDLLPDFVRFMEDNELRYGSQGLALIVSRYLRREHGDVMDVLQEFYCAYRRWTYSKVCAPDILALLVLRDSSILEYLSPLERVAEKAELLLKIPCPENYENE